MRFLLTMIFLTAPVAAFAHNDLNNIASLPHHLFSLHHLPVVLVLCVAIVVVTRLAVTRRIRHSERT